MPDFQDKEKPTLDALLKFKRREQPDAAFWRAFDGGLKQKLAKEFVSQQRSHDTRAFWLKLSAVLSAAGACAVALMFWQNTQVQPPAVHAVQIAQGSVSLAQTPTPILEQAALRETAFAALKNNVRDGSLAMSQGDSSAQGYTRVLTQSVLDDELSNVRFVAGANAGHAALPGVSGNHSFAY